VGLPTVSVAGALQPVIANTRQAVNISCSFNLDMGNIPFLACNEFDGFDNPRKWELSRFINYEIVH